MKFILFKISKLLEHRVDLFFHLDGDLLEIGCVLYVQGQDPTEERRPLPTLFDEGYLDILGVPFRVVL